MLKSIRSRFEEAYEDAPRPPTWLLFLVLGLVLGAVGGHFLVEPYLNGQLQEQVDEITRDFSLLKIDSDRCLAERDRLRDDLDNCRDLLNNP